MNKTHLNNGLRVVTEKIPTCRSVAIGIWVKTGSRNETQLNNGISHFIEHMLFKGTERHSAKDIAEVFDGIGGNVNAFTSKEYTCYYAKVLDEHLGIAVDILSDMFFNSVFNEEELEKEKNVIFEEIAMYEDTPDDLVHDLVAKAAYGSHPLGYTILGTQAHLSGMKPNDLRAYMKECYTIENTVIAVAGNIDDSVFELLEKHFGHFNVSGTQQNQEEPAFMSERVFQSKTTEQNHICLSLPGLSLREENLYPMVLLNNAIGGGMSSRLFQEIREKRGLAYSVYSYHSSHIDNGVFTIYTGTAPKQTEEVLKVTIEMLHDIAEKGMTDAELRKGKEQLKGSLILSLESTNSRMNRIGKNELMTGRHYTLDEMINRIESVEMEHIHALTRKLFSKPFAIAMVGSRDEALQTIRGDELLGK
ncbi:pitrilysin family protein [Paenibacillus chitinolyticus]|uniref:M16 family metallopeptidase n=1 Tax=Paenibacillus chitinolyticus TaxID=79263 RepID=UPI002DBB0288|nr:pitrilysin family protein [Paenibacillus chitinolyticus]MEC0246137.1 pitrilysin family protein [Paenibacillus chitinolyticus]